MMRFPLIHLLDEAECYRYLERVLHPGGLVCPNGHPLPRDQRPHKPNQHLRPSFRCRQCHAVFNLFTGTVFSKTHYSCRLVVLFLRGVVQGVPTCQLAAELCADYSTLLKWRHRLQGAVFLARVTAPLPDAQVEVDEMFQNAGAKGEEHDNPDDPPRRRANKRRGRGTYANDRPPIAGVVGRESGQVRLQVVPDTTQATVEGVMAGAVAPGAMVYSDEATGYEQLGAAGYGHETVRHSAKEWARDADGDGQREVHDNELEGLWAETRTFLRGFRGVHKKYLGQYVSVVEWARNLKTATAEFLRALFIPSFTYSPT